MSAEFVAQVFDVASTHEPTLTFALIVRALIFRELSLNLVYRARRNGNGDFIVKSIENLSFEGRLQRKLVMGLILHSLNLGREMTFTFPVVGKAISESVCFLEEAKCRE